MKTYKQKHTSLITQLHNFWLVMKYPFLKPSCGYGTDMEYYRKGYRYRYESTWMDNVPAGWRDLVLELCKRLKQIIKEDNLKDYRITQVKEKWGELCWYYEGGNQRVRDLTIEYEKRSRNTCINCGKTPTKYYTKGWITYICEDCADKYYAKKKFTLGKKSNKYD